MSSKSAYPARFGPQYVISVVVAAVALGLSVVISSTIITARASLPKIAEPPAYVLPGNPLPDDARCNWPPNRGGGVMYCHVNVGQNRVYLTYDPRREMIIRSSIEIDRQTIGSLMAAWGTPTGLKRSRWSVQIQWDSRYVYAYGRPFEPDNPIFFVFYSLEAEDNGPWTGFVNRN
jgi:hypothetical protein